MEKISIHRGLAELKLLDSKIQKKIDGVQFVSFKKKSVEKIGGVPVIEVVENIKSNYQSVVDLIERRSKIKSAIIKSNALTEVKIGEKTMSVAEAIDMKNSLSYNKSLLSHLSNQYNGCVANVNRNNEKVDAQANTYIENLYTDKNQVDPNKIKTLKDDFIKVHEFELIDPINAYDKIKQMQDEIDEFLMNVDFVLSESNSLTFIEI